MTGCVQFAQTCHNSNNARNIFFVKTIFCENMFQNLMDRLFGERDARQEQQNSWPVSSGSQTETDIAFSTDTTVDPEVSIIAGRYGELCDGKAIETTLSELQEILPRKRKRADAYRTVSKKLSEMGVQLVIKRENGHGKV